MKDLVFGFYGEGIREYGFLMPIVERTLEELLPQAYVLPPIDIRINEPSLSQAEKLLRVAKEGFGLNLVVFHLDADAPNAEHAREQRFLPGYREVQNTEDGVNKDIVPVIPIRMTDAWMLTDFDAFRNVVGTRRKKDELGFPNHPHEVESVQEPKVTFERAIKRARPERRKTIPSNEVYEPLARQIDLQLLIKVPAYREFVESLSDTLKRLHYLD